MLDLIDLDFDYQEQPLLKKVTFHLSAGALLHLRGPNGSGKTTLMKLIAGLYAPIHGQIHFEGIDIREDLPAYQHQLCFVGHKTGINPFLSLRENCIFDIHFQTGDLEQLASIFKLQDYLDAPCGILSAGQRRQVGLLRLWMTNAKLWLLDEPLVALDEGALSIIMKKIEDHRKHGGGVLITSHQNLPMDKTEYQEYLL